MRREKDTTSWRVTRLEGFGYDIPAIAMLSRNLYNAVGIGIHADSTKYVLSPGYVCTMKPRTVGNSVRQIIAPRAKDRFLLTNQSRVTRFIVDRRISISVG